MGKKDISKEDPGKEEFQQIPSLTRQIIATCPGWSNSFFLGLGWGYISAGYDSLRVESELGLLSFPVTDYDVSQLASLPNFGLIVASLISGNVSGRFGRKWPWLVLQIVFPISWILTAHSVNVTMVLIVQIAMASLVLGLRGTITTMYTAECAHSRYRGQFLSSMFLFILVGMLVEYIAGTVLNWYYLAIFNVIVTGVPLILLPWFVRHLPESHVWLVTKGRLEEAKRSMQWSYGDEYNITKDFQEVVDHQQETSDNIQSYRDIFQFQYLKPVFILAAFLAMRHFCGGTVILTYMGQIFRKSNSSLDPKYASVILGTVQVVFVCISGRMMDTFGRKKTIILSAGLMGCCEIIMGGYLYLDESPTWHHQVEKYNWIPVVVLSSAMMCFGLGLASSWFVLLGEVIPNQIKNVTNGLMTSMNGVSAFCAVFTFHMSYERIGGSGIFWVYGAICFLLATFVYFAIPETKGKTLSDIERVLTKTSLAKLDPDKVASGPDSNNVDVEASKTCSKIDT